jgi:peptidyl-prolyl cis-trans isomerase B (cyclophilin B)
MIPGVTLPAPCGRLAALMKNLWTVCALTLALGLSLARAEETKKPETKPEAPKAEAKKDDAKAVKEVAVIKTTEGEMVLEFYPDVAPKHVENFKKLAKKGFYDGQCFHRVIKGFMIQGGDPNTKDESKKSEWGQGGPGYTVNAEFNQKPHVRGTLSMARTPDPNSAGSQFFICHGAPSFLDGQYTVFGQLIKGDDVLEKIATTTTEGPDRPVKRMGIESVKIVSADSVK